LPLCVSCGAFVAT